MKSREAIGATCGLYGCLVGGMACDLTGGFFEGAGRIVSNEAFGLPLAGVQNPDDAALGLGQLRSEFGEPIDTRASALTDPIWNSETLNYSNRQYFPAGVADERLFLNVLQGGGDYWLSFQTKSGNPIRKVWYARLVETNSSKTLSKAQLKSMGTFEAHLARNGLRVVFPKDRSMAEAIRRTLRRRCGYAVYLVTAVVSDALYCSYLKPDGTVIDYSNRENDELTGQRSPVCQTPVSRIRLRRRSN